MAGTSPAMTKRNRRQADRQDRPNLFARDIDRHRRPRLAGIRPVFVDPRGVRRAQAALRGGGEIAGCARRPSCIRRARDRTRRRRRDRRAASACSRRRFRSRGSRPREYRCGARDRPSARCCRSSTGASKNFCFSRAIAAGHVRPSVEPVPGERQIVAALRRTNSPSRSAAGSARDCAGAARRAWRTECRPERTSSMPGWYSPRQASAKAVQSRL